MLDPHDDFLDTPRKKALKRLSSNSMKSTSALVSQPKNRPWGKAIAMNLPTRKKADCELLTSVSCPMCLVFYEALGSDLGFCDHVVITIDLIARASRHRYNYLPPNTPPGF